MLKNEVYCESLGIIKVKEKVWEFFILVFFIFVCLWFEGYNDVVGFNDY